MVGKEFIDEKFIERFVNGEPMETLSAECGLSRQRTYLLLRMVMGDEYSKAVAVRRVRRAKGARRVDRATRFRERAGADKEVIDRLLEEFPNGKLRYSQKKSNATRNGIRWNLSLHDFLTAWIKSGHLGKKQYAMGTKDPEVGYEPGNIVVGWVGDVIVAGRRKRIHDGEAT